MSDDRRLITTLVTIVDKDFEWMLGEGNSLRPKLRLPPGGVESKPLLAAIRRMTLGLHQQGCEGAWMMVSDDEVVGLCSYRRPPFNGAVEIGYGVSESRRRLGHATRAVSEIVKIASRTGLTTLTAETSIMNPASARVLEKNDFVATNRRLDPEDGEVQGWRRDLT